MCNNVVIVTDENEPTHTLIKPDINAQSTAWLSQRDLIVVGATLIGATLILFFIFILIFFIFRVVLKKKKRPDSFLVVRITPFMEEQLER
jgi:uncharacterized BrkB/YihY/UPF0761 family membrane protein